MGLFNRRKAKKTEQRIRRANIKYAMPLWIRGDYTLQNNELIFSAVSRISNAFSAMPVRLYRGDDPVTKHTLQQLLGGSPNPNMTASNFFKTMEACRCTNGNTYALIGRDENGRPERLDILDPSRVKPTMEETSNELYYRISPANGPEYFIHNYHVIHIPFLSTNGYEGLNPVSVLFDTLSYNEKIHKFSVAQLEKGINAAVVISAPASLGEAQREGTVEALQEVYRNTGGNILFLESGLTANSLNLSPVDTKLFEVEKISRGTVAMVYTMPPHMLGDYSDTSYTGGSSAQEQQMLEFLTLTMLPIVTAYEQELEKKLLTPEQRSRGYHVKFYMDAILRADAATQADVNQKAIRGGWKTPNEVRAEKGQRPTPEGNKLLVSRDLIPLDYLMANPNLQETKEEAVNEN